MESFSFTVTGGVGAGYTVNVGTTITGTILAFEFRKNTADPWVASNLVKLAEAGATSITLSVTSGDASSALAPCYYRVLSNGTPVLNGRIYFATAQPGTGVSADPEVVRDVMALALVAGANMTITPDDIGDTITLASATDPEVVRDTVAASLRAGANISIVHDDVADTITIGNIGVPIRLLRTADRAAVNNSIALVDDGVLQTGNLAISTDYLVSGVIFYTSTAIADLRIGMFGPTGATGSFSWRGIARDQAASSAPVESRMVAINEAIDVAGLGATVIALPFSGVVRMGTTAGTVSIRIAQATAEISDTFVRANSFVEFERI